MAQVFVVVAAGSVIGFIVRDVAEPELIGASFRLFFPLRRGRAKLKATRIVSTQDGSSKALF